MASACSPVEAATLAADKACYREGEPVSLTGGAFSPGGPVELSRDGTPLAGPFTADPRGNLAASLPAPGAGTTGRRAFSITATARAAAGQSATLTRLVSRFDVRLRPAAGRASLIRRIDALGFTAGGTLYAHVVRGRRRRTVRVGTLSGACGNLSARKRLLRAAGRGTYRVQFDTRRRYSRRTVPRVTYRVPVSRRFLPSRSARGHTSTSG